MRWLDVVGPPGVGKSTLCDELWPPRSFEWDRKPHPEEWDSYLECVERLLERVKNHPSYRACVSMTKRSHRKMATVSRMKSDAVYIQTGFAQRGLGIGWRLANPEFIAFFYQEMPISAGVVVLWADVDTIIRRNIDRGKDRAYMVPKMEIPSKIAVQILRERGVSVLELDTRRPVKENKIRLLEFANA